MGNNSEVICVDAATVRFGTFTAVDQVTLSASRGEILALLGPNGSGKTTLMRAACGLLPLAGGEIRLFGQTVSQSATPLRRRVGYMSQNFAIYEDLTAEENIDFYGGIYGLSQARKRRRKTQLVELTGLAPHLRQRAGRLSGGWRQRLALVCALLHGPDLVFLDEPTAGIDPVARRQLWDLLFAVAGQGVTLIVSTHYMDEAERCDRIAYLHLSKLLAVGRPHQLRRRFLVTPAGTRRVEIATRDAAATLARLRQLPAVREATIFGQCIRALVDESARARDLGLDESSVRPATASLEDALLSLSQAPTAGCEQVHAGRTATLSSGQTA